MRLTLRHDNGVSRAIMHVADDGTITKSVGLSSLRKPLRPGDTVTVRKPNGMLSDITVVFATSTDNGGRCIGDDENHVFYEGEGCTAELISRPDTAQSAELAAAHATIAAVNAWNHWDTANLFADVPQRRVKHGQLDEILTATTPTA